MGIRVPRSSDRQRKESFTTGSFAVAQFDLSQKPLVAFGNVPIPVIGNGMQSALNQTFAIAISNIRHTAHHAATHTY